MSEKITLLDDDIQDENDIESSKEYILQNSINKFKILLRAYDEKINTPEGESRIREALIVFAESEPEDYFSFGEALRDSIKSKKNSRINMSLVSAPIVGASIATLDYLGSIYNPIFNKDIGEFIEKNNLPENPPLIQCIYSILLVLNIVIMGGSMLTSIMPAISAISDSIKDFDQKILKIINEIEEDKTKEITSGSEFI